MTASVIIKVGSAVDVKFASHEASDARNSASAAAFSARAAASLAATVEREKSATIKKYEATAAIV